MRILFIRGGAIGDFVLTLPLLGALREKYPDSRIEILGYASIAELAVGRELADEVRRVDGAEWAALFSPDGELGTREKEHVAGFDLVICIWPDEQRTIWKNLKKAGAKGIVSIDPSPDPARRVHIIDHLASQCEEGGVPLRETEPRIHLSAEDRAWAEERLRLSGFAAPFLAFAPGSGSRRKNWPLNNYLEVARSWVERGSTAVAITGPAEEWVDRKLVMSELKGRCLWLADQRLPNLAAVLERCRIFVGNDSGVTHIAASVGAPTIAIFGPTDSRVWRPLGSKVNVLEAGEKMAGLTPQAVLSEMERLSAQ